MNRFNVSFPFDSRLLKQQPHNIVAVVLLFDLVEDMVCGRFSVSFCSYFFNNKNIFIYYLLETEYYYAINFESIKKLYVCTLK